jgi:beta-lactamase class A
MSSRGNHFSVFIIVGALIFGGVAGFYSDQFFVHDVCNAKYILVNADLLCSGRKEVLDKTQYTDLRYRLQEYIESEKKTGMVSDVAVYFRDLHQGPVLGINETADFAPASLLKLPLAMLYEMEEEKNEGFLESSPPLGYTMRGDERSPEERRAHPSAMNMNQAYPPPEEIQPGERYTIDDLLFRMLAYSDNKAFTLLSDHIIKTRGEDAFIGVYQDLGVLARSQGQTDFVSVRSYASLFRLLYNASFVNAEYSEKLLEYMSKSTFTQGLVAGVPEGVPVSHKFGERGVPGSGEVQLHDCGIVYFPENPYVLCVLTRGQSMPELAMTISHISQEVYEEVNSRRK